jgi:hypothetical protein
MRYVLIPEALAYPEEIETTDGLEYFDSSEFRNPLFHIQKRLNMYDATAEFFTYDTLGEAMDALAEQPKSAEFVAGILCMEKEMLSESFTASSVYFRDQHPHTPWSPDTTPGTLIIEDDAAALWQYLRKISISELLAACEKCDIAAMSTALEKLYGKETLPMTPLALLFQAPCTTEKQIHLSMTAITLVTLQGQHECVDNIDIYNALLTKITLINEPWQTTFFSELIDATKKEAFKPVHEELINTAKRGDVDTCYQIIENILKRTATPDNDSSISSISKASTVFSLYSSEARTSPSASEGADAAASH